MYPYIHVFGKELPSYWLMSMIGILAVGIFAFMRRKKLNLPLDDLIHIALYGVIGAIIGAKIVYFITIIPLLIRNFVFLTEHLDLLVDLLVGGYVFYGGLLGALFMIWIYCRKYAVDFKAASILFAAAAPLFHIFGRIGCFLAGCCYGVEACCGVVFTNSPGAPNGVALIPTQLIEAFVNLLIFISVLLYQNRAKRPENSLTFYFVCYAVARFVIEFFRGDEIRGHFLLSTSQWISVIIIAICAISYLKKRNKNMDVTK